MLRVRVRPDRKRERDAVTASRDSQENEYNSESFYEIDIEDRKYIFRRMNKNIDNNRKNKIMADFPHYPFPAFLGLKIEELQYGIARLSLKAREELTQGMNFIHGGALTTICDTAVAVALMTMIDDDDKILTIELKTNFIAPADTDIQAVARILHKGRKTAVGEVDVTKADGTLVAKSLVTYYIYRDN